MLRHPLSQALPADFTRLVVIRSKVDGPRMRDVDGYQRNSGRGKLAGELRRHLCGDLRFNHKIHALRHKPVRIAKHGGGHAGYYVSPVHDYRNVSDCGLDTWREGNALARELPAAEIGHSVESA